MSTNEIQKLRIHFHSLNVEQKKRFVGNLQHKLRNSKNPEYKKFLNECIHHYNSETQVHSEKAVSIKKSSDEKEESVPSLIFWLLLWTLLGIALIIGPSYQASRFMNIYNNGLETVGTITEIYRRSNRPRAGIDTYVRYNVDGAYHTNIVSLHTTRHRRVGGVGDEIIIMYHPDDPSFIVWGTASETVRFRVIFISVGSLLVISGIVFIIIIIVDASKKQTLKR